MTSPISQLVNQGLIDPEQSAFFANSNMYSSVAPPENNAEEELRRRHLEESAIGLAAAFIVMRNLMSRELQKQQGKIDQDIPNIVAKAWKRITPTWLKLAIPALMQAYSLGSSKNLTEDHLTILATDYAINLGTYINSTSAEALSQGFNDQLKEKWSEPIAWMRATEAYGLDKQQMKTYVKQVMTLQGGKQELIPLVARVAVDKAMVTRAEKLGDNEAFHASKLGQSLIWLIRQKNGELPSDTEKQWITADDERVCQVCGPLHGKRVKLNEQWRTIDGDSIWAPGIHPKCRCDVRLIYPEIANDTWSVVEKQLIKKDQPDDPYDRDTHGRFANREQRRRGFRPVAERTRDAVVDDIMEQAREVAEETVEQIKSPFAESASPFTGSVQSPFASGIESPFATQSPFSTTASPFGATETPFAKPPRGKRRTVLIFAPGQPEPVEAEVEADDDSQTGPFWTFWNSVREANPRDHGHAWGEVRDVGGRNDAVTPGQIINFDFHSVGSNRPDPAVVANQLAEPPYKLAELASDQHYGDINRWVNDPVYDELTEEYDEAYRLFHEAATANMESILARLRDSEIREIFREGNLEDQAMIDYSPGELREIIDVRANSQHPVIDSTLRYLERVLPDRPELQEALNYGYEHEDPSGALIKASEALEDNWVPLPHTPTILVFDKIIGDTYHSSEGNVSKVVRGQYRVKSVEDTNANFYYIGDTIGRPKNIGGWRVAHLEPIPSEEEVLSNREYRFGE